MHNDQETPGNGSAQAGTSLREREALLELTPAAGELLKLSPTDIAQYIRLAQCRRALRLSLVERNTGRSFMEAWDVQAQSIPPLLTLSGREFEEGAETEIGKNARTVTCNRDDRRARGLVSDNQRLTTLARDLAPGQRVVVFQPLLKAELAGWDLTGVADAIDIHRSETGELSALIIDFKSTTVARMEHRLQIAFYDEMLRKIFADDGLELDVALGILFRGAPGENTEPDDPVLLAQHEDARATFGVDGYLERIEDPHALRRDVKSLVLGEKSEARRNLATDFEQLPYHLNYICDGCLYNQLCLRQSAEVDDLSLIPFIRADQKHALHTAGIRRCADLAAVSLPNEATSTIYRDLSMLPALGADLDDLIVRARTYRASKGDDFERTAWLPDPGQSSLPRCDTEFHPNLVTVSLDVEHDYLHDRIYLLGALVTGAENGTQPPERRRTIVELAPGPPDDHAIEATLLRTFLEKTIAAIADVAAPDADGQLSAPIHLIFYDAYDQRVLMNALARHLGQVFGATPLYDFVSQLAAYTSPVLTLLADELRAQRNFPLLCQSLQSIARYLRFPWDTEHDLTGIFRERYFDAAGRFEDDEIPDGDRNPWFTRRSRFSSQLPLEYAYAAWGQLPEPGRPDPFEAFRAVTPDDLIALHEKRLQAIEQIASRLRPNRWATKAPFDLSNLANFEDISSNFAMALDEFITIERHVALGAWKHDRAFSPERRVLSGVSMLARYHEDDQSPQMAQFNRELYAFDLLMPGEQEGRLKPKGPEGDRIIRLRVDLPEGSASVEHAMSLWGAETGDRIVISRRWDVDSRKPVAEREPYTPTVRQLFYGASADITGTGTMLDTDGRLFIWIDVKLGGFGGGSEFAFFQPYKGFEPGGLLTLDTSPNDWYGSFQRAVVTGLREGKRNALFQRIAGSAPEFLEPDPAAVAGQARFLQGLQALEHAGLLYGFEESKHRLIGELAEVPTLLVQGPPGTGKSLTASYAILARIQGAMAAGRDCRVIIACKTHAAVDELMRKLVEVIDTLAEIRANHTHLWDRWFDIRLLSLPIFRYEGKDGVPAGVVTLDRHQKGDERTDKQIEAAPHCVIAAGLAGVYRIAKEHSTKKISIFDYRYCDVLVLDEASQINLPEAIMGALALKDEGQLIVIGDHRQMPPIVQNDWEREVRRTFVAFRSYESLFLTLRDRLPNEHQIRFQESFRVHRDIAEFLRQQIYRQDGIAYFSQKTTLLPEIPADDPFVRAVLDPIHPLTVVIHDEMRSQKRNVFEQMLMKPVLEALAANNFDPRTGLGVVVPHTAQRSALRTEIPALTEKDPVTGVAIRSAVDTVERFQGAERMAIVVGATESDPLYLLANSRFLLDPRRLNVAISRAKSKLVLVGSRSIFELFATDEDVFASAQLWKNLLEDTCTTLLWDGAFDDISVQVWGNVSSLLPPVSVSPNAATR